MNFSWSNNTKKDSSILVETLISNDIPLNNNTTHKESLTLKEILISNGIPFDNDKIKIPDHIKKIKLDIGIAIEAVHTEYWLNHNPDDLVVFGFEPLPLCVEKTIEYFQQPNSKWTHDSPDNIVDLKWLNNNFYIVPVAIGNDNGKLNDFYVTCSKNVGCSSLYKPSNALENQGIVLDEIIQVPVFNLSEFLKLLPFDKFEYIEYIKVDVQGNDLNVIKSGGDYIREKVVFITMEPEVGQYIGANNNTIPNMINYMNSIRFDIVKHHNTVDPTFLNRKFKSIADSIYIKQFT